MIQAFVDRFMEQKLLIAADFSKKFPESYEAIVKRVVQALADDEYDTIDPEKIHKIDDGDYQGNLLFVVGSKSYQTSHYWAVMVAYGSCSGCDTLQALESEDGYRRWDTEHENDPTKPEVVEQLMTMALHIVQGLKEIFE